MVVNIKGTLENIFSKGNLYMLVAMIVLSVVAFFVVPRIREWFKFAGGYANAVSIFVVGIVLAIVSKYVLKGDLEKINIGTITIVVCGYLIIQTILDEIIGFTINVK